MGGAHRRKLQEIAGGFRAQESRTLANFHKRAMEEKVFGLGRPQPGYPPRRAGYPAPKTLSLGCPFPFLRDSLCLIYTHNMIQRFNSLKWPFWTTSRCLSIRKNSPVCPSPRALSSSIKNEAVCTQDRENLPSEKGRFMIISGNYPRILIRLEKRIPRYAFHEREVLRLTLHDGPGLRKG